MKKFIITYDFLGERVTKEANGWDELMMWLETIDNDPYILNNTVEINTVK